MSSADPHARGPGGEDQPQRDVERRLQECTGQLAAAQKELEMFSYAVSHDLRAPLRAIHGFAQALLEDFGEQLPEEGQFLARTIDQSAQQMGLLFDDLLRFSRLSRMLPQRQKVVMSQQVQEAWEALSTDRQGREIALHVGPLPNCEGDPALLQQLWSQLLSNAVKFASKREQPAIEVGFELEEGKVIYYVRDNGIGFDMRYAGKLFGLFQCLHRQEEFAGRGVGLALVKRIVHFHGGTVWAEAKPSGGAVFRFHLGEMMRGCDG